MTAVNDAAVELETTGLVDGASGRWVPPFPNASSETRPDTNSRANKSVLILGTRGVPARHGGFETFAHQLSLFLAGRGWSSSVYCQVEASEIGSKVTEELWEGVVRIQVPSRNGGSLASITYDLRCILDAARRPGTVLLLGYNTAVFAIILRLLGRTLIINMDGLEWQRPKWSRSARLWLWFNERVAARLGHTLVADHPAIRGHLSKIARDAKLVMIPYGATPIMDASAEPIATLGLTSRGYYICISRIEPENSQLQIVTAFAAAPRRHTLVVVGNLDPGNAYHRAVRAAASENVRFVGAIWDKAVLASLRFHAAAYCHGHTVGGTNPSLVEALGAGCAVLAHDNRFNRWTAGPKQFYFKDATSCRTMFEFLNVNEHALDEARDDARTRHHTRFLLEDVLRQYERLIGFDLQTYCQAAGQDSRATPSSRSLLDARTQAEEQPAMAAVLLESVV